MLHCSVTSKELQLNVSILTQLFNDLKVKPRHLLEQFPGGESEQERSTRLEVSPRAWDSNIRDDLKDTEKADYLQENN